MAWSQGWGQKWFTAPPTLLQKEGRFTPTSMGNVAVTAHWLSKDSAGVRSLHPSSQVRG